MAKACDNELLVKVMRLPDIGLVCVLELNKWVRLSHCREATKMVPTMSGKDRAVQ